MRIPVPAALAERAAAAQGAVAPARDAATIALLRAGPEGVETYLLRRQSTMEFAPGQYVFPGGSVQESDREDIGWVGPPESWWAARFSCDVEVARALVVAAVRETFEESGILLAGPDEQSIVADTGEDWSQQARLDLEGGRTSLAELFAARQLVLRADLLGPWSHWITPAFEPRRYDTRFFVAAAPPGQRVGSLPGEADRAAWVSLKRVTAAVRAGEAAMLPPTWVTCRELEPVAVDGLLDAAGRREIVPIEPCIVEVDGELFLENPVEDLS
ncbi:NUDIX hydrolase [Aeromicrobium sp. CTD01-1L150]|uniref:NUDIX hydrolase n=1 Tax=Aeromicrobium sp. CTD01-1L150 TaxID=3341830 RepID=UPI0035C2105D